MKLAHHNRSGASKVLVRRLGITKAVLLQIALALESTLDVIEGGSVQNIIERL